MSLINDALKRAARQRAEDQAEVAPPAQAGRRRRIPRRGDPMSVQALVLLAGGAVTLIVASVVITGIVVTGKIESKAPVVARPQPAAPKPQAPPAVVVQVPRIPALATPEPSPPPPAAAPVEKASAPLAAAQAAPAAAVTPVAAPPPVAAAQPAAADRVRPAAVPQPSRSEQAQSFVDRIRVTGARAAGSDSKALVDGHVYRVNDILDRALGIRLVQVESDHLTLVDSEGATYIKNF